MHDDLEKREGILLRLAPYRDKVEIATLFFPDEGLVDGMFHRQKPQFLRLYPPLRAEWIFRRARGQLIFLEQLSPLDHYVGIRKNYETMMSAAGILRATLSTQGNGRPAPHLYRLCADYLRDLGRGNPRSIAASYHLKTLRHEGWLDLFMPCPACGKIPLAVSLSKQGTTCTEHHALESTAFTEEETQLLQVLAYAKQKEWIYNTEITSVLADKIVQFFEQAVKDA